MNELAPVDMNAASTDISEVVVIKEPGVVIRGLGVVSSLEVFHQLLSQTLAGEIKRCAHEKLRYFVSYINDSNGGIDIELYRV